MEIYVRRMVDQQSKNGGGSSSAPPPLECQLEARHQPVVYSTSHFLWTAALLPIVSMAVLPLSLAYQVMKTVSKWLAGEKKSLSSSALREPLLDTGYTVDPSTIIPRTERKYDIVLLGATGFTGSLAARHLAQTYGVNQKVKWAIAGRNQAKLDKVKTDLANELNNKNILNVDTILVDTTIPSTMPRLVQDTRVVATTAGPFCFHGSPVVEFCAKFGTHYVDITGEVSWVKTMILKWQTTAQRTGAILVPFCGHDSVPWDLSAMKLQEVLKREHNEDIAYISFWDVMNKESGGGTWESIVANFEGKSVKPPNGSVDPFLRLPDGSESEHNTIVNLPFKMMKSNSPWDEHAATAHSGKSQRWTVPFIMAAVNGQVVRWSYALRQQGNNKEIVYREAEVCADFKTAFVTFAGFAIMGMCLLNPLTGRIYRRLFGHPAGQGPSLETMENHHFIYITGEGVGVGGHRAQTVVYYRKSAGCIGSAVMMIESALCLALEKDRLPVESGGFWTPSIAMGDVLLCRLQKTGLTFKARAVPKEL